MGDKNSSLINTCSMESVRPIMMELPYPEIKVIERNQAYANILSIDYCGSVSEMSAITQYINNENRLSCEKCPLAKTILGIAMAEMIHLQKLGEMICLLGGNIDYIAKYRGGKQKMWTPESIVIADNAQKMIMSNIEAERAAIKQYRMHMRMINDNYINSVLARIIKDEEYHIMLLQTLMDENNH